MSEELKTARVQISVAASPERLFQALTSDAELEQWFAEHANVSLDTGAYSFWGIDTPDLPDPAAFSLLEYQAPSSLSYRWRVYEADTRVDYLLTEQSDGDTQVQIEQSNIPDSSRFWDLAGFWSESLDNLRAWVERGAIGERFHYTPFPAGDVHQSVEIDKPPAEVFPILIDPERVERWMFTSQAEIEPRVGGIYHNHDWDHDGPQKILSLEPDQELSYSWKNSQIGYDTVVTWTLEGSGGKTRLTLVHSGFTDDKHSENYHVGWHAFLNNIKHYAEEGETWIHPNFETIEQNSATAVESSV